MDSSSIASRCSMEASSSISISSMHPPRAYDLPETPPLALSRRDLLAQFATGLGGMALATLLARDAAAAPIPGEAADPPPHHPPKARRAIQIFLQGGLSQVDSFD